MPPTGEHECVQKERIAALETESKVYKGLFERIQDNLLDQIFTRLTDLEKKYAVLNVKFSAIAGAAALVGGILGALIGKYLGSK